MKNFLGLIVLMTLISCGKSSQSGSEPLVEKMQNALMSQKAGMVYFNEDFGTRNQIESYYENGVRKHFAKSIRYSSFRKEVVLKVEGDLIYIYKETKYENFVSRSVDLESISKEVKIFQDLNTIANFRTEGDRLVGSFQYVTSSTSDAGDIIGGTSTMRLSYSKDNSVCDFHTVTSTTGSIFKTPTETLPLPDESHQSLGTCGKTYTTRQLQEIDLSYIRFCDDTDNSTHVCTDRDMRFLTADL